MATRLERMLRRQGVDPQTAEDVVQETALRALRSSVWFEDADDLFRWASVVAKRVAVDASRKQRWVDPAPVPDHAGPTNVALQVEQRSAVEALGAGLRRLSASDRQALLETAEAAAGLSRREAVRLNVRRHRARSRLLALVEGFIAAVGWLGVRRHPKLGRLGTVSAAMVVPVLSSALFLVPQVDDEQSRPTRTADAARESSPDDEVTLPPAPAPAPTPAAPPPASDPAPAPPDAHPAGRAAGSDPPLPTFDVQIPLTDGQAGARVRRPDDHDLCLEVAAAGLHPCVDAPAVPAVPIPVTPPAPVPDPSMPVSARSLLAGTAGARPA